MSLVNLIAVALLLCCGILASTLRVLKPYAFAVWVLVFVAAAYFAPEFFRTWGGVPCTQIVAPLIQIAMFGMGATLTAKDFARVLKMPKAIAVGMFLQFLTMPLLGWSLAIAFGLPSEIAAGVVLVGACPGGVSSNVITYLAKGNVALSVTMTACSTAMSPLMTPLAMSVLAGRMVEVPFLKMMSQILWIVFLPIGVGLLVNAILRYRNLDVARCERFLSVIAMVAICIICAIIMADAHQSLAEVGLTLLLVVILHNLGGFAFGYFGARAFGLDESACRTVAIEVGMQNGGLGASLAMTVLKSPPMALASAIFAPWMNASGSVLAAWWRKRDCGPGLTADQEPAKTR
jgi:bile acid:Na+ symporter, BASS family